MTGYLLSTATVLESPACGGREPAAVGGGPTPPQPPRRTKSQLESPALGDVWGASLCPATRIGRAWRGRGRVKPEKQTYFPAA